MPKEIFILLKDKLESISAFAKNVLPEPGNPCKNSICAITILVNYY